MLPPAYVMQQPAMNAVARGGMAQRPTARNRYPLVANPLSLGQDRNGHVRRGQATRNTHDMQRYYLQAFLASLGGAGPSTEAVR
jgi:hypothetical protein